RTALDASPHLVSLSGHGNPDGCCGVGRGVATALTNRWTTSVAFADSCLTNAFDQESLGEAMVLDPDGGGVGYVGNTRFSWVGCGDDFSRAFFHRLTTTRHLGALNDTRCTTSALSPADTYG